MSRDALVVGISTYEHLQKLDAPAADAEAIAQRLSQDGNFQVKRLPTFLDPFEGNIPRIGEYQPLNRKELEEALVQLFLPKGRNIPDTALFYFSGHGIRKERGLTEGFLATSDVDPEQEKWGIQLKWLRELLQESPVRQQIIWLDCCYSGEFFNFDEANPGDKGHARDRCFIAASREYEAAYIDASGYHSVLTQALLQGLNLHQRRLGCITNYDLITYLNQTPKSSTQRPIFTNTGSTIELVRVWEHGIEYANASQEPSDICPYKGLAYFDCNDEDAKYFHGRTTLVDKLLNKIRQGNFVAILGASGSGKSSVVRAGLLHELQHGNRLSGSSNWLIRIFRPGEHPLRSLSLSFLDPNLSDINRAEQFSHAEKLISDGADGLRRLILPMNVSRIVLVVDQFEEVFTLCQDKIERERFFGCLLDALELIGNKLCVIITMRADFFGKCAEEEYSGLSNKIQENLVTITPLNRQELEQAIVEPAKQERLEVEPELVTQLINDVEGAPGSLPLLQYTLKELWKKRTDNQLTLRSYTKLNGIRGALEDTATAIYNSFSEKEKKVSEYIFLELTHLGEGTEDTRRQVRKRDLVTAQVAPEDPDIVDRVLQKLAGEEVRLLVTSEVIEKGTDAGRVEVVDVAHEALIRNWSKLRNWLNATRDDIRKQRKIEEDAKEWLVYSKPEEYLLAGPKLAEAQGFLEKSTGNLVLSDNALEFVQKSIRRQQDIEKEKQEEIQRKLKQQRRRHQITATALGVTTITLISVLSWLWFDRKNSEIKQLAESTELLSNSDKQAAALIEGLRAVKVLKDLDAIRLPVFNQPSLVDQDIRTQVIASLRRAVYTLRAVNSLEGHYSGIQNVSFSPNSNLLVSVDSEGVLKLWKTDGTILRTIQGHTLRIEGVGFSPDGNQFATSSWDGTVKLWNRDGKLLKTLLGHSDYVYRVIFNPIQPTLASASEDGSIRIWSLDGQPTRVIQADQIRILDLAFKPDGRILASSGVDGTVKLWNPDNGSLLKTFHAQQCNTKRCNIWGIAYTSDGKFLATASDNSTIKLWNSAGVFWGNVGKQGDQINALSFGQDKDSNGTILASASRDQNVKLWIFNRNLLSQPSSSTNIEPQSLELLGHDNAVNGVSFSFDGKILASTSLDKTVKLWSAERKLEELGHGDDKVKSVSFSPDGKMLVSASHTPDGDRGNIRIWRWDEQIQHWKPENLVENAHSAWIWQVKFSPDGKTFASVGEDKTLKLWSQQGKLLAASETMKSDMFSVGFSSDGKTLISGDGNGNIIFWQYQGNALIQQRILRGSPTKVRSVSFSPDGQQFASVGLDKTINLWKRDRDGWNLLWKDDHNRTLWSVGFSPDGQLIAASSDDGVIKLWNRQGALMKTLYGHTKAVTNITFSPDSQILASTGADKTVMLWSRNGDLLHKIRGHEDGIYGVAFSPDGKMLASASDDGRVIVWNLNFESLVDQACVLANNYARTMPEFPAEVSSLCKLGAVEPTLMVEQGQDLARQGKLEEAIAKLQEAQKQGLTLKKSPNQMIEELSRVPDLLKKAREEAKKENFAAAINTFKEFASLEPALYDADNQLVINVDKEVHRLYALNLLNDAAQAAIGKQEIRLAIESYEKVKALYPEIQLSVKHLDALCRAGSDQPEYADRLIPYCSAAIELAPRNGKLRDSRGIARLFQKNPNFKGAVEDFQAFINWTQTEEARSSHYGTDIPTAWEKKLQEWRGMRQQCIKFLSSGQNKGSITAGKNFSNVRIPDNCKQVALKYEPKH